MRDKSEIDLPDDTNDAPTDLRSALDIEELVQPLLVRLLLETSDDEVENTVEHDDDENQHIAVILSLVDRCEETEPFHEQGEKKENGHHSCQRLPPHFKRLANEVSHRVVLADSLVVARLVVIEVDLGRGGELSLSRLVSTVIEGDILVLRASCTSIIRGARCIAFVGHSFFLHRVDHHLTEVVELACWSLRYLR